MRKNNYFILIMLCAGLVMTSCASKDDKAAVETREEEAVETIELGSEELPEETAPAPAEEVPAPEPVTAQPLPEENPEALPAEEASAAEAPGVEEADGYTIETLGETKLYATETVNIRKGPSKDDFEVVGKLKGKTEVTATGKVNGYNGDGKVWYRIKRSEGEDGFVSADYLTQDKPAEAAETAAAADPAAQQAAADPNAAAAAQAAAAQEAAAQQAAAAQAAAAQAAAAQPVAVPVGGTHNMNGLVVNDAEYRALLDTWRWATEHGTDEEAEHYVLKHNAGDLESVLKSKGLR